MPKVLFPVKNPKPQVQWLKRITTKQNEGTPMPVQACMSDGRPGYQFGDNGKCYTYDPQDEASRKQAKQKAFLQGAAITAESEEVFNAFPPPGGVPAEKPGLKAPLLPPDLRVESEEEVDSDTVAIKKSDLQALQDILIRITGSLDEGAMSEEDEEDAPADEESTTSDTMVDKEIDPETKQATDEGQKIASDEAVDPDDELDDDTYLQKYFGKKQPKKPGEHKGFSK